MHKSYTSIPYPRRNLDIHARTRIRRCTNAEMHKSYTSIPYPRGNLSTHPWRGDAQILHMPYRHIHVGP